MLSVGRTTRIPGFYRLSVEERLKAVKALAGLSDEEVELLKLSGPLPIEVANRMVENVIATMPLPLGIATNFLINGRDYLVPMAIEEPSVIAAASNAARMARHQGGFKATSTPPIMIGQIQLVNVKDVVNAMEAVAAHRDEVLAKANEYDPTLVKLGGGARDVKARPLNTVRGLMLIVELYVDVRDAMGANVVNTMCEGVAPLIEELTGGKAVLRILTNLAVQRLARAEAVFAKDVIGGEEVVEGIMDAYAFALADPYRAATHNKGIMNGVVAVALATANDTRALEAGAHAYASRSGRYQPLTSWTVNRDGDLVGSIELPIAVGVVGGATSVHPVAKICRKILGVKSACELAEVMAAVGLAQNFAALRALAVEGIQRGHLKLHSRNLAMMAGATGTLIDVIAARMVTERKVSFERAKELLEEYRAKLN
ncbi:MAG: hydroxymethylglutaryl-CoA reductase, degradative [Candidatus Nezhaarchaeales archaeon]